MQEAVEILNSECFQNVASSGEIACLLWLLLWLAWRALRTTHTKHAIFADAPAAEKLQRKIQQGLYC